MSLRLRLHAQVDQPARAWSETLSELAEVHRSRRSTDEASRWPLAHACTRGARAVDEPHDIDPDGARPAGHAFCCRALA